MIDFYLFLKTGGFAEFVTPKKIPSPVKVLKQLQRAKQPALKRISVDCLTSDKDIVQVFYLFIFGLIFQY